MGRNLSTHSKKVLLKSDKERHLYICKARHFLCLFICVFDSGGDAARLSPPPPPTQKHLGEGRGIVTGKVSPRSRLEKGGKEEEKV